jgi:DNA adenine methylase
VCVRLRSAERDRGATLTDLPRPIVKWVGGKNGSIPHILAALPATIETYYEPFFGGGAVFFALARAGRFKRAVISDSNPELMAAYRALRDDYMGVVQAIEKLYPSRVYAEKYNRIRASKPRTEAGKAARFLFLNKTGFNGLYRVNMRGEFNVPYGSTKRWRLDVENLSRVSLLLRGGLAVQSPTGAMFNPKVDLRCRDFGTGGRQLDLFNEIGPGDACYFDPPYLLESKTARFTGYTQGGFTLDDHRRLAELFDSLAAKGVHVVASNADVRGTMRLYEGNEGTDFLRIPCRRAINSNGKRRGHIGELLMTNPGKTGESRNDVQE